MAYYLYESLNGSLLNDRLGRIGAGGLSLLVPALRGHPCHSRAGEECRWTTLYLRGDPEAPPIGVCSRIFSTETGAWKSEDFPEELLGRNLKECSRAISIVTCCYFLLSSHHQRLFPPLVLSRSTVAPRLAVESSCSSFVFLGWEMFHGAIA